jgi:hypothetical protein
MITVHLTDPKDAEHASVNLTPLPMPGLIIAAWKLLDQAPDLAQPVDVTVSDHQSITLQFAPKPSSIRAITRWALRFGGVLRSEPHQTERGPQTWCRVEFDYYGVSVKGFAHIPAGTATT